MADERDLPPCSQPSPVPEVYAWFSLITKDGYEFFDHINGNCEERGLEIQIDCE